MADVGDQEASLEFKHARPYIDVRAPSSCQPQVILTLEKGSVFEPMTT